MGIPRSIIDGLPQKCRQLRHYLFRHEGWFLDMIPGCQRRFLLHCNKETSPAQIPRKARVPMTMPAMAPPLKEEEEEEEDPPESLPPGVVASTRVVA